jgi:hypothetical protein
MPVEEYNRLRRLKLLRWAVGLAVVCLGAVAVKRLFSSRPAGVGAAGSGAVLASGLASGYGYGMAGHHSPLADAAWQAAVSTAVAPVPRWAALPAVPAAPAAPAPAAASAAWQAVAPPSAAVQAVTSAAVEAVTGGLGDAAIPVAASVPAATVGNAAAAAVTTCGPTGNADVGSLGATLPTTAAGTKLT